MPDTKPISRKSAADRGATHELYEPRLASELFPRNGNTRSWVVWLEQECKRLILRRRNAVIFYDRGQLGLAVDCLTDGSTFCEPQIAKFGVH